MGSAETATAELACGKWFGANHPRVHPSRFKVILQFSQTRERNNYIFANEGEEPVTRALWPKHINMCLNTLQLCKCMHKPLQHDTLIPAIGHSLIQRGIPGLKLSEESCWYGFDCVPECRCHLSNIDTQQVCEFTSALRCTAMNTKPLQQPFRFSFPLTSE